MKLLFVALLAAQALTTVNAGNINWKEYDPNTNQLAGLELIRQNRDQVNTAGIGGCAVAVTGCIGAVVGFCFCVAGPQAVVCTASALPAALGSFFGATFTAAMYECNAIGFQGLSAKQIRCKAVKILIEKPHEGVTFGSDVRKEYNKCFGKEPECRTKECARRNGH